ncbi:MAG: xanthine dehydrogenase small subunit [Calditrichia bacterium]
MSTKISFVLDGKIVSIDFSREKRYTPTTTVLNYLRSLPNHKGTKEGCAAGDCGACTVVLGELGHEKKIHYKAVDSCLLFLPILHGKQLITIEDLNSSDNTLHPVQQAMVDTHGSQCGFCTPGIVMSLFALYKSDLKPTRLDIEESLSGNLCRCTGYAPIIEAAEKSCLKKKKDHFSGNEKTVSELLQKIKQNSLSLNTGDQNYFCPKSVKEALQLRKKYPNTLIICGATDIALRVTKNHEKLPEIIDLSFISALQGISHKKNSTEIMAGTSLSEIKRYANNLFPALHKMLTVFGSDQIRNMATIGGNLATASPIGDIAPLLMAYHAKIVLVSKKKKRKLAIEDFITGYRKTVCRKNELISAVTIPHLKKDTQIKYYKFSKRKDLDISTVSGGFCLELTKDNKVKSIKLAFGGMALFTKRAYKTEKFLEGVEWSLKKVEKAGTILEKEFRPISDARAGAEGRMLAAQNLLIKFWSDTKIG